MQLHNRLQHKLVITCFRRLLYLAALLDLKNRSSM